MKLTIDFPIKESEWKINPDDGIVCLGSCFSEEIGARLLEDGFYTNVNPFGVVFHPIPIANLIHKAIKVTTETNIVQHNDVVFSWDAAGTFFGYDNNSLLSQFNASILMLHAKLKLAKVLIITFGTAYGYRHKELNQIVANCHKQPSDMFKKEMTDLIELEKVWQKTIQTLKTFNPALKIIFTVSPVKHLKDGVEENVRSKARLLELVSKLNSEYFPSFEIVQEELRDYRYFKADGAHPNELAVDFVYNRFAQTYFSEKAYTFKEDYSKYSQMKKHKVLYAHSEEAMRFQENVAQYHQELIVKYPFLKKTYRSN